MKNLLTADYWLNLAPAALIPLVQKTFVAFVVLLAGAALLIAITKGKTGIYHGFFKRLYSFCLSNAIIGLLFLFVNYESVPFFSARFWLALWAIEMTIWLAQILKKLKTIPQRKKERDRELELKKYLPK